MSAPVYASKQNTVNSKPCLNGVVGDYRPFLGLWLLNMAFMFAWYRTSHPGRWPEIFDDEDFCKLTGLDGTAGVLGKNKKPGRLSHKQDSDDKECRQPTSRYCKAILNKRFGALRNEEITADLPLFSNISLLADMIGLSEADQALLAFAAAIELFPPFRNAISSQNVRVSQQILCQVLARITGLPEAGFSAALGENGLLVNSGIIKVARNARDIEDKLELMDGFGSILKKPHASGDVLTSRFIRRASHPSLTLGNFPHLTADTGILRLYLKNALIKKTVGVNILLHGKPGVGKTEYAQALAAELSVDLYEVDFSNEDGDSIKGEARLRAYTLCQCLLSKTRNAMLLFDEIEDVFPNGDSAFLRVLMGGKDIGKESAGKAWINRTMERNLVPAIWISNQVDHIDPAFLRRFDYSAKFPIPPPKVRLSIAEHHLGCFNPPQGWLENIAANEEITPGQLDSAAKVARIASDGDNLEAIGLVEQALYRSASLLDQKRTLTRKAVRTGYKLSYLSTDADIPGIIEGLKRRRCSTFCFYGAAGTGKSELARYIADEIGKPIIIRRASDLLDKYVGESEKNIAAMFSNACGQDAVLLLDEADSFLRDRRDAVNIWEVTQVNELLTQMEAFEGVFICTTNLMEKLDPASLRRFAFKVRFDPLNADQRWMMFRQELTRLGGNDLSVASWEPKVRRLGSLTPGDFAVAARQFDLLGTPVTADRLYDLLHRECEAKGEVTRKIGF
ncbi:MAG: ATP-binding protein [Deltaproteobacteria bacterium]